METLIVIGLVMISWIFIWAFIKGATGGCGGDCNQGRTQCNCKNK